MVFPRFVIQLIKTVSAALQCSRYDCLNSKLTKPLLDIFLAFLYFFLVFALIGIPISKFIVRHVTQLRSPLQSVIDTFIDEITLQIGQGNKVNITGFGTFEKAY